jgi:cell division protein ZapA (FtsZ GTPase activity inhibitor)
MKKLAITVEIAGRPYKLTIDRENEEVIRKAAKSIEEKMKSFAKEYAHTDTQDLLGMIALQYATATIHYESAASFRDHQLKQRLVDIDNLITGILDQ